MDASFKYIFALTINRNRAMGLIYQRNPTKQRLESSEKSNKSKYRNDCYYPNETHMLCVQCRLQSAHCTYKTYQMNKKVTVNVQCARIFSMLLKICTLHLSIDYTSNIFHFSFDKGEV